MNAISELSADLTTPLLPGEIVDAFEALADGRTSILQFNRSVLEACRADPSAAEGVLVLIEEYTSSGKLQQFDFRPMRRVLRHELRRQEADLAPPQDRDEPRSADTPARVADDRTRPIPSLVRGGSVSPVVAKPAEVPDATVRLPPFGTAVPPMVLRGRYALEAEIGRGGVGTVYRALDRNRACLPHERQYVAVKVLRDEHARRPEALRALRREFYQAQSLSHPGIVNVFDFDRDGDTNFFTMELLDGESLGALMRNAQPEGLQRDQALRILRELGEAVVYAHERGVLHLDLKPGNVMVSPQGHVRVLDFGLAQSHRAEPWISEAVPLKPSATPAYASPERLAGELPDVRDDIFSFACLGYELLSGAHPFDRRPAPQARSSGLKPRRIRALSRRQWQALKSGLAWSREERPDSMQALLDDLVPQSGPNRRADRTPARARTFQVPWRSIAALTLLGLGIAAIFSWDRLPEDFRLTLREHALVAETAALTSFENARGWVTDRLGDGTDDASPTAEARPVAPVAPASTPLPSPAPAAATAEIEVTSVSPVQAPASFEPPVIELATPATPAIAEAPPASEGPGILEFAADTVTVSEADSVVRVHVRRRGGAGGEVSFDWHTVDDSAADGVDYASRTGSEVMAAGQTRATILVPIVTDTTVEPTELFDVVIDDTSRAQPGRLTQTTVIIVDDD